MILFQNLFGVNKSDIQEICIITPFLHKGILESLGVGSLSKGFPYATGQGSNFSLIYTHIGAGNVGDAVLYLEDTPCTHIVLIGSCGLVEKQSDLDIGSIVTINQSFNYESFSDLLENKYTQPRFYTCDNTFLENFLANHPEIKNVDCASFGSIKLEDKYIESLQNKEISVVDMECSAFFAATRHIKRQALALLYITDILNTHHIFEPKSGTQKSNILDAQNSLYKIIKKLNLNN